MSILLCLAKVKGEDTGSGRSERNKNRNFTSTKLGIFRCRSLSPTVERLLVDDNFNPFMLGDGC